MVNMQVHVRQTMGWVQFENFSLIFNALKQQLKHSCLSQETSRQQ